MAKKIDVGGELNSTALDKKLVDAAQVKDSSRGEKTLVETNEEIEYLLAQEGERQKQFEANEAARQAEADKTEQDRADEAARTEAERQATFEANEAERQMLYDKVEKNTEDIDLLNANTGISEYPEFSEAKAYAVGEVVLYEGLLKRFISAHEAGAWDASQVVDWSERKEVDGKVAELEQEVKDLYGDYTSNAEYIRAYTDAEGKFLWGIKTDGSIEFAKGVPTPIKEYIASIDRENDEEIERINNLLIGLTNEVTSIKRNVTELTDTYHYISNEEWIMAVTDSESRILIGLKADGSLYIPNRELFYKTHDEEYIQVVVDNNNNVLFGIRADGSIYIPKGISDEAKEGLVKMSNRIDEIEAILEVQENFEYIQVILDSEGKVLQGRTLDGINEEKVGFKTPKLDIKGHTYKNINDLEDRIEIKLDNDNKILSYRDSQGVLHERKGIDTPNVISDFIGVKNIKIKDGTAQFSSLSLTENGMSDFKKALIDSGFNIKSIFDWSERDYIHIPEPRIAYINFTNIDNMPTTKTQELKGIMEFWDCNGNYFKKNVIMNAQGNSTLGMLKTNCSFDICNNVDWDDDNTTDVKIGNWVAQDSFHLKAFYTDYFRGIGEILYNLWTEIEDSRGWLKNRTWKRALIPSDLSSNASSVVIDDLNIGINDGAYCHPMGFPSAIFLNGEFYGVFAFQLKKHRDNYMQDKRMTEHIHLDGVVNSNTFFSANGDASKIGWNPNISTRAGFEIRNPKGLVYGQIPVNMYDATNTYGYNSIVALGSPAYLYKSLRSNNVGHSPIEEGTLWWEEIGIAFEYDSDIVLPDDANLEIAGNSNGSNDYPTWISGIYDTGEIVEYNGHLYMSIIDNNSNEPIYDKDDNADDSPDFKNKTGCYWLNVTNTVKVKEYILEGSKVIPNLNSMMESSKSDTEIRAYFEEHYDVEHLIDYILFSTVCYNRDDNGNNWQVTTWDGCNRLYFNPYDLDNTFGSYVYRWLCDYPFTLTLNTPTSLQMPTGWVVKYYKDEIKARWNELYNELKILTPKHIMSLFSDWINRVGYDYYKKEYKKWNASPCNRDPLINTEYWNRQDDKLHSSSQWDVTKTYSINNTVIYDNSYYISLQSSNLGNTPALSPEYWENITYDAQRTYHVGDKVIDADAYADMIFVCNKDNVGENVITGSYNDPKIPTLGYQDSTARVAKWIEKTIDIIHTNINNL